MAHGTFLSQCKQGPRKRMSDVLPKSKTMTDHSSVHGDHKSKDSELEDSVLSNHKKNGFRLESNFDDDRIVRRKSFSGQSTFPSVRSREGSSSSSLNNLLESEETNPEDGDNVNVVIRVRPFTNKEMQESDLTPVMHFPGNGQITVDKVEKINGNKPKNFTFNVVFEPNASQQDVFEHSGVKQMIEMALEGFSCTIFAYGQTGSGKTHTLAGPHTPNGRPVISDPKLQGLMQSSFHYLFRLLAAKPNNVHSLQASFLEIYNEQVKDLLNPGETKYLTVRWAKDKGFYVENLFMVPCFEEDDVLAVMEEGLHNRQVASNNVNENSSRSHCILTLNITSEIRDPEEENSFLTKHGQIIFVDLAGSEKVTEKSVSQGSLNETNKINRSLLTLGKCISALGDPKKKSGHIPYRDSKLTKLLKHCLGGNGVTLMIACISPSRANLSETLNTLYYAARTKRIKNKPHIVLDPRVQMILSLKREVKTLKAENQYLREQLQFPKVTRSSSAPQPAKNLVILEKLTSGLNSGQFPTDLNPKEVHALVTDYVAENETLRDENADLLRTKEFLIHDHEMVVKENERLTKKLETLERNAGRSPGNSSLSSSSLSTLSDVDSNNRNNSRGSPRATRPPAHLSYPTRPPHRLPESISKELQRRRIGENLSDSYKTTSENSKGTRRRNSWDNSNTTRRSSPAGKPKQATAMSDPGALVRRSESDQHLRRSQDSSQHPKKGSSTVSSSPSVKSPSLGKPKGPHKERVIKEGVSHDGHSGGRSN